MGMYWLVTIPNDLECLHPSLCSSRPGPLQPASALMLRLQVRVPSPPSRGMTFQLEVSFNSLSPPTHELEFGLWVTVVTAWIFPKHAGPRLGTRTRRRPRPARSLHDPSPWNYYLKSDNRTNFPSGIVNRITGIGYLVRTGSELVRTSTYSVQSGTGNVK